MLKLKLKPMKPDLTVAKKVAAGFIEKLDLKDIDYTILNGKDFWEGRARTAKFSFPSQGDLFRARSLL